MIEWIEFKNFRALRDATLPLSRFTLIVGPNGSGKSTALQALKAVSQPSLLSFNDVISAGCEQTAVAETVITFTAPYEGIRLKNEWQSASGPRSNYEQNVGNDRWHSTVISTELAQRLSRIRFYSLDAPSIALPQKLQKDRELASDGTGLVTVLDQLRDNYP